LAAVYEVSFPPLHYLMVRGIAEITRLARDKVVELSAGERWSFLPSTRIRAA
jgi:hypothetical protein